MKMGKTAAKWKCKLGKDDCQGREFRGGEDGWDSPPPGFVQIHPTTKHRARCLHRDLTQLLVQGQAAQSQQLPKQEPHPRYPEHTSRAMEICVSCLSCTGWEAQRDARALCGGRVEQCWAQGSQESAAEQLLAANPEHQHSPGSLLLVWGTLTMSPLRDSCLWLLHSFREWGGCWCCCFSLLWLVLCGVY